MLAIRNGRTGNNEGWASGQGLTWLLPGVGERFLGVRHLITRDTCLNLSPFPHLQPLAPPI